MMDIAALLNQMTSYGTVWAIAIAVAFVGCKSNQPGQAAAAPASSTTSTTAAAPIASTPASPVEQAEAAAEDLQTAVEQNAWPAAEGKLRELKAEGAKLASAGVPDSERTAYENALVPLGAAITDRSRADALTTGNRISRIVTGIMAAHPGKVPIEVGYMDVAGRDALYAAQQKRWKGAGAAVTELGQRYAAIQSDVRTRSPALDQKVSAEISKLQGAVVLHGSGPATTLAQTLLEDVDSIERLY
jgi:hypothetical protein